LPVPSRKLFVRAKTTLLALTVLAPVLLAGCAASPPPAATTTDTPHGYVEGASESTEPQLHAATVNASGELALLDLLSEETSVIGQLDDTTAVTTDGRYVFASSASGDLSIVDTGTWTVDHEDHSHYYRATPSEVGVVEGTGAATVHTAGALTGIWFAESGEGIVLDYDALGDGEIVELARIDGEPHAGALVPLGGTVIATQVGADGSSTALQVFTADGEAIDGATAQCLGFSGSITTSVGAAFGCADGAVLATVAADDTVGFERIAFPADSTAPAGTIPATHFGARKSRPTVAALAGTTGAWLLDTRERTWTLLPTEVPLLQVDAADDRDGNVVALAADGRILVLDPATGATVAATAPLLAASVADPELLAGVELTVDTARAYINAPAEGLVYEIDYADGARIAREFPIEGSPLFLAETGR
jgi:hypothetical protein